jgi:PAS domain S-box-containing protein
VGLAEIDVMGSVRHVNQAFFDIFGYSTDELMAHTFDRRQLVVSEGLDGGQATLDQLGLGESESVAELTFAGY